MDVDQVGLGNPTLVEPRRRDPQRLGAAVGGADVAAGRGQVTGVEQLLGDLDDQLPDLAIGLHPHNLAG